MKNSISLWLILFFYSNTNAQSNLVSNPSFEQISTCPSQSNPLTLLYWYSASNKKLATNANSCNPTEGVPSNSNGFQYARTGDGYAGLFYLNGINQNKRNYLQIKLIDSLKSNKSYYVEYFVSLGDYRRIGCNNISLLLTDTAARVDTFHSPFGVLPANAQIFGFGNPIITDTMNWVKISAIYKAKGGEQYLTLGNFKYDNQTSYSVIQPTGYNGAGYFIDDVSVIPLDSFCLKADAGRDTTIKVNDSVFIGSYTNGIDTIKWYNAAGQVIDSVQPGFWVKPTTTGTTMYIVEQTVNGCFSKDTVYVNVILPLRMLNYELRVMSEKQVLNEWETANEVNVHHFNIQRSINAKDFTTIGTVRANNKSYNEYNYIDGIGHWALGIGKVYYRIESIDKDGKINYSAVNSVELRVNSEGISVYPNPAKDVVTISSKEPISKLLIIDYLGRTVYEQIASCLAMTNNTNHLSLNINHYPRGLYVVRIITNSGKVYNEKLIVE